MARALVLSFEERARRDALQLVFLTEITVILAAAFLAAALFRQHMAITLFLGLASSTSLAYLLLHESRRETRRLALAEVRSLRQLGYNGVFFLPWSPMFSLAWSGYEVEVITSELGKAVFIDWRPRKVGERLLILLDRSGSVLAVTGLRQPVRLDTLRKLV
ncbi:MAG: hypothetical protein QW756_04025 [Nitrososphaerota archaeon]